MKKIALSVSVIALLVTSAFAQNNGRSTEVAPAKKTELRKERNHGVINDIPDLTEKQKTEIKAIRAESRKTMEPRNKELRELRNKISELKRAENPDQTQINRLIDKSAQIQAEIKKAKTDAQLKTRKVLTAEQRKVLDAKQENRKKVRDQRHSKRMEMKKSQ